VFPVKESLNAAVRDDAAQKIGDDRGQREQHDSDKLAANYL
jgi:hypothetical protein